MCACRSRPRRAAGFALTRTSGAALAVLVLVYCLYAAPDRAHRARRSRLVAAATRGTVPRARRASRGDRARMEPLLVPPDDRRTGPNPTVSTLPSAGCRQVFIAWPFVSRPDPGRARRASCSTANDRCSSRCAGASGARRGRGRHDRVRRHPPARRRVLRRGVRLAVAPDDGDARRGERRAACVASLPFGDTRAARRSRSCWRCSSRHRTTATRHARLGGVAERARTGRRAASTRTRAARPRVRARAARGGARRAPHTGRAALSLGVFSYEDVSTTAAPSTCTS